MVGHPRVSIIIPFYNAGPTISRAVESVVAQTFADWEMILVDDASPAPAQGAFVLPDRARCRIIRHDINKGGAAARNTGVRASTGDWVAFLDADDRWHPEKLERQISAMETAGPNVVASVTGFTLFSDDSRHAEVYRPGTLVPLLDVLADGCSVSPGSTLMVARRVFDDIGMLDQNLRRLEDWDWLIRFSRRHGLLPISDILADIFVSRTTGVVNLPAVLAATCEIRTRYLGLFSAGGWRRRRRFLSTLLVEDAAAFHRAGSNLRCGWLAFRACLVWPLQFGGFLRRILRRVGAI